MLSDLQRRKISTLFKLHDLNGDGVLTPQDYEAYAEKIAGARGFAPGSDRHDALVLNFMKMWEELDTKADRNHDKKVTLEEWLAYYDMLLHQPGVYEQVGKPIADSVFSLLDANGDGVVTSDDYALLFSAGSVDPTHAATSFTRIDVDKDGRVTPAELTERLGEFFMSNDPNAPGNWLFGPF